MTESCASRFRVDARYETTISIAQIESAYLMQACRQALSPSALEILTASSMAYPVSCFIRRTGRRTAFAESRPPVV